MVVRREFHRWLAVLSAADAERLRSPRLRMPTLRLLLLLPGNRSTDSGSMCRNTLARSSSCRQQWIPGVITSRAVALLASKLSPASPLQTISRSVTMPISRSFSPIGMAPMSCSRINFASSVTGVSGLTQSTPLCIASLTFMADLRCRFAALGEVQRRLLPPAGRLYNGSGALTRAGREPRGRPQSEARLQVLAAKIDRRIHADHVEMSREPAGGAILPDVVQVRQEPPVRIELAHGSETLHHVIGLDRVDQYPFEAAVRHLSVVDELGDECDRAHLAKQRRVEADLVDAIDDLLRRPRYVGSFGGVDVNHDDVAGFASVDQRKQRGIAHVSPVPEIFAVDLDRLAKVGQARGGEHVRRANLLVAEDPNLARAAVCRAQQKLDRASAAQRLEMDDFLEQRPEGIVVAGIEMIGREHPRHEIEESIGGGMLEPVVAGDPVVPRGLQDAPLGRLRDALPEVRECADRALAPADGQAVGEHDGVHGAGTCRADAVDFEPRLFQEVVQNAPGESAMGTSALQREIGNPRVRHRCRGLHSPGLRPLRPAGWGNAVRGMEDRCAARALRSWPRAIRARPACRPRLRLRPNP